MAIYSSDRTFVRPEWASPFQFNHLIVAIRVSDAVALPIVLEQTPLGGLLIFDPTDPITPVGDLPIQEQGSEVLLVSASRGRRLPSSGSRYGFTGMPASRHAAIRRAADLRHDLIRIKLPNGFKLNELQQPARIETPFGRLEVNWTLRDGQLSMEETIEIRETLAPASDYSKIRDFFRQLAGAD